MDYHEVSANQTGALGEALLTGHSTYATDIVEAWITATVAERPDVEPEDTVRVTHDHRVETYYVNHEGEHISWSPDCLFTAWVRRSFGALESSDERRIDVPIEVKTGEYAELERNQRAVMELVGTECDVVPVVAAVDLEVLPNEFGVEFRAIAPL